ncbi:hypothetical protein ACXYMU_17460 [Pontibacter sp. CAU 1760]
MKLKHLLIALTAALVIWFIYDTLSIPNTSDLPGNFREVAMYRNENNTGPITRIYAVSVDDTLWNDMEQYGNMMPHTKYGNTKVYFFIKGSPMPARVQPGEEQVPPSYQQHVAALYEKDAMGQATFRQYPFAQR